MTLEARRAVIGEVIECAFVGPGRGKVEDRLFVCLRGRAPAELPPCNPRSPIETRRFDPVTCPASARLRARQADWGEPRLLKALQSFLAGRESWPGFTGFQAAGLASVYTQVQRQGGPERWATLCNVDFGPATDSRAVGAWSEDRVRDELSAYLEGKTTWPTVKEFIADGRTTLRWALKWFATPEWWARELGVTLPARERTRHDWPYARMKAELAVFTADRSDWPPKQEFYDAGLRGLYNAIRKRHARRYLASDLGLALPDGPVCARRRWTNDAVEAALAELLDGPTSWPTAREFETAGLSGLRAMLRQTGTLDAWAQTYGLLPAK
jgi:hypothetical protein